MAHLRIMVAHQEVDKVLQVRQEEQVRQILVQEQEVLKEMVDTKALQVVVQVLLYFVLFIKIRGLIYGTFCNFR